MTTTLYDPTAGFGAWALQARTDAAGSAVDDYTGADGRLIVAASWSEGIISPADGFIVRERQAGANMSVDVGSGDADADIAVVEGVDSGQGSYLVRLGDALTNLTIEAADLSNPRIDEVYLVVQDNAYDSSSRVLPRLAVRKGTPVGSPSAPGPDAAWKAYLLLAQVAVAAGEISIEDADIIDSRVVALSVLASQTAIDAAQAASDAETAIATHAALTNPHAATAAKTADRLVLRDGSGRAKVEPAAADDDILSRIAGDGRYVQLAAPVVRVLGNTDNQPAALDSGYNTYAAVTFNKPAGWNTYDLVVIGVLTAQNLLSGAWQGRARAHIGAGFGSEVVLVAPDQSITSTGQATHSVSGVSDSSLQCGIQARDFSSDGQHISSAVTVIATRET